jgi:hypothetical protein
MATAAQVSKAILQEILVHGAESQLEAVEFQDTIFAMNNYMTAIDANGIHLGYTVVSDLGDTITVPAGALQGIISNVAVMVAPQFGAEIPQGLAIKAKVGLRAMRKLGVTLASMQFPGTLPLGSGNETTNNWDSEQHFFFNSEDNDVSTETNQNIGLESST